MNRTGYVFFFALAATAALTASACSSGEIAVGASAQALQKQKDGTPTGNGAACDWDLPVSSDPGATGDSAPAGTSKVGDNFKAPDGCNDCTCTAQGIACTERACGGNVVCTDDARQCPDGSSVGRSGPFCQFDACPPIYACPSDARSCPDGSSVGRSGPKCEFSPCPTPVACDLIARQCPDGSSVGRVPPSCDFAPCPQACDLDVPNTCPPGTTCQVPSGLPTRTGTCK